MFLPAGNGLRKCFKGNLSQKIRTRAYQGTFPTLKIGGSHNVRLVGFQEIEGPITAVDVCFSPSRMEVFVAIIPALSDHCILSVEGKNCC